MEVEYEICSMKKLIALASLSVVFTACDPAAMQKVLETANQLPIDKPVTTEEIASGLKEALSKGAQFASGKASVQDAFFGNNSLKILWPPDAVRVEQRLRQLGFNKLCDDFVLSVNRAAEQAAAKAAPIFVDAITKMTINDAMGILKGGQGAATDYLKRSTTQSLTAAFRPVIENALASVNATKHWTDITTKYNQLPFVTPVNSDLAGFVTNKAIDGLFVYVAEQENAIRRDPLQRSTELLKRVFKLQD